MAPRHASSHGGAAGVGVEQSWSDLAVLLAAWRARSLTGAARELGVNQSTASRRLAALEGELGGRLFDRTPDGLVPTALAADLLPHAEAAETTMQRFRQALAGLDRRLEGDVRLAVPDGIDSLFLAPRLPAFFAQHPGVALEVVASATLTNLARREADLALRFVRPTAGDLISRRVATLAQGVWGTAERAGQGLAAAPWITWEEGSPGGTEAPWEAHFAPAEPRLRVNRADARLAAARAGVGLTILPDALAVQWRELVRVEVPEPVPSCDLWLVAHRALFAVPRVRAVWTFLVQSAEEALVGA